MNNVTWSSSSELDPQPLRPPQRAALRSSYVLYCYLRIQYSNRYVWGWVSKGEGFRNAGTADRLNSLG